jgi:hypothetical protein
LHNCDAWEQQVANNVSPEDLALVEREIGKKVRMTYADVPFEPLPERFSMLLEQLAAQEARRVEISGRSAVP